ncbi:MAG: C39 family peptidase [Planctomycetes bacterium]|nr:C39 family peptidase [Planctomycetota bacterium]
MTLNPAALALFALLAGSPAEPGLVLIEGVPHVRQKPDFCGEACAAMALAKLGHRADQDLVFDRSGLDPLEGRGCHTKELERALRAIGFAVGEVWHVVGASAAAKDLESLWKDLLADLRKGVPSIACMRYSAARDAPEHFRLVLGYDPGKDEVLYHEPAEEGGAYRRMARGAFLDLWPLKYDRERWTVIRLRLEAGRIALEPSGERFTAADYAQHVRALKRRLPRGFSLALAPPFVVAGDETAATVRRRARDTVAWAVGRLKEAYFDDDPEEIIDVWLFKDNESYERNVRELFGKSPATPFGYYSADDRALVMNIATGGGTLVHEIVHPFVRANFPACPAWLNEGLASLYEQSGERDGKIAGFTNWRLAGLQEAVRAGKVPTFRELTSSGDNGFYRSDRGTNYAQARYLCYYLQEKGLLGRYYREALRSAKEDPTGYETLKRVLGKREDEMPAFEEAWRGFVMGLRYP